MSTLTLVDTDDIPAGWTHRESKGRHTFTFGDTSARTAASPDYDQALRDARIIDGQIRAGAYPDAQVYAFEIDDAAAKGATVAPLDSEQGDGAPAGKSATVALPRTEVIIPEEVGTATPTVTPRRLRARRMHQYVEMSTQVKALALFAIQEEKLYLDLGSRSFKEYCELDAGVPYRTAMLYTSLGRRTAALYPGLASGMGDAETQPLQITDGADDEQDDGAAALFGLGPSKLSLLFQHVDDEDDLKAFAEGETITLPSGREMTLDEYGEMKRAEAIREFKPDRTKLQKRALKAEEDRDKLKAEIGSTRDTVRSAESEIKAAQKERDKALARADRLDVVYGGEAKRLEAKETSLATSRRLLNEAHQALANCGIDENDPEELRQDLADVGRKLTSINERFQERYAPVLATLPDRI